MSVILQLVRALMTILRALIAIPFHLAFGHPHFGPIVFRHQRLEMHLAIVAGAAALAIHLYEQRRQARRLPPLR